MKILVLGAGVVGTAAAYWLARDGHEVTVVERHPGPAQGTSYSNAGLVSPGDATAWASPAALKTFIKALYTPDLGIRVKLRLDPYFYVWTLRFLLQCTTARMRANTLVKLRLALHSRDVHQSHRGRYRHRLRPAQEGHPLFLPLAAEFRHRNRQLPLSRRERPADRDRRPQAAGRTRAGAGRRSRKDRRRRLFADRPDRRLAPVRHPARDVCARASRRDVSL